MRRRIPYRVCKCLPNGVVTHLEARLLRQMVNSAIHPIRCAATCKQKYKKGMYMGDLCAETGHFYWAMKVWRLTERLIEEKDWNDWRYVWFNTKWVSIRFVLSEAECELLARRRSDLWRALGFPEEAWWTEEHDRIAADTYGSYYTSLWVEKYDYDPYQWTVEYKEMMGELKADYETEQLFSEALPDYVPVASQNFTDYWADAPAADPGFD